MSVSMPRISTGINKLAPTGLHSLHVFASLNASKKKKLWPGQNSCFRLLYVFQFQLVFKIEIWELTLGGWNHRHDEMHFHFQVKILVFFKILWGISSLHLFFLKSRNLSFIRDGRLFIKTAAWEKLRNNYCASSQLLKNFFQVLCWNFLLEFFSGL